MARPIPLGPIILLVGIVSHFPAAANVQTIEPIVHTIRVPAPESHVAEVEARVPTDGKPSITLMMPVWSPGFYRVEDYARRLKDLSAKTADGQALDVEQIEKNRWRIQTKDARSVVVTYKLTCEQRSVTTNWVGKDLAVFNGGATYLTLVEASGRPHEV